MILVDYREDSENKGSHGLWDDLKQTSLPIEQSSLEGGDLMFLGNGPDGKSVTVGVEFKKVRDLLSSIRTKRLQGKQIPKLMQYDYRFLLIEGEWRHDKMGKVTVRGRLGDWTTVQGGVSASELDKFLLGMPLRCGIIVQPVATRRDTVRWVESLYRNFTDGPWDDHASHIGIYRPPTFAPLSEFREAVCCWPGIGIKTSAAVEQYFHGSIAAAATASAKAWSNIDGVGVKKAQKLVSFLRGE